EEAEQLQPGRDAGRRASRRVGLGSGGGRGGHTGSWVSRSGQGFAPRGSVRSHRAPDGARSARPKPATICEMAADAIRDDELAVDGEDRSDDVAALGGRWAGLVPWAIGLVVAVVWLGPALGPGSLFNLDLILPHEVPVPRGAW